MSSLNILHLSDFHIGNFRYNDPRTLSVKIANTLYDSSKKVDVIVVSGDIFDGRREKTEYDEDRKNAILLFDTLISELIASELVVDTFSKEDILFVPGNHDLLREKNHEYEKYDTFIDEYFTGGRKCTNVVFSDKYSFYYVFPEKKIAILGFNSCKIETEAVKTEELKWIDKIDLSSFSDVEKIKEKIREEQCKEKKWDDFGYIDTIEMNDLFRKIKKDIPNLSEYTIVATFHHHFYPFPEIVKKYGDPSWIRNYQEVVDNFFRHNVSIVLHGHKHLSIHRAVTDNKYFENPDAVIYVLAAGSVGCKDVHNPSFQWLRVFEKQAAKIAEVERYDFKDEELGSATTFTLPPQKKEEKSVSIQLLETLQTEDPDLYKKYVGLTDEFEQVFHDNNIDKIIEVISGLITIFKDINRELQKDPKLVFALLICINYRVIYLRVIHADDIKDNLNVLLNNLEDALKEIFSGDKYAQDLLNFLKSTTNKELDDTHYEKIIKNVKASEKRYSAYLSIGVFFTDLFLNISQYGEYYFEKEGIKHKINIKLDKEVFYNNIPNQTISIEGNIDRRAIILNFKCKNPTVHKIAVLIVKDFEMRLTKFEDSLKEINLKLYYILPKVQPDKYDLENFHFDAYIPTLLPLLTGENLYKQREVFIRELVQNSIDAILLRQKLEPHEQFDRTIRIELGTEKRGQKQIKYFKIMDEGIGMTNFTIERYFTSIGRSFYVSEEFDELQKNKNIKYQAISNFGIGFLSSFMVCKEVLVKTRSILDDGTGLEIEIPNYEGCFFIRNHPKESIGTEITLYEDSRDLFQFDRFIVYAKNIFLNTPLKININNKVSPLQSKNIDDYSLTKELILNKLRVQKKPVFFVPFNNNTTGTISWEDLVSKDIEDLSKFGYFVDFSDFQYGKSFLPRMNRNKFKTLNQGLAILESYDSLKVFGEIDVSPIQYINYSSSFIQLDVSREKIINFKKDINVDGKIIADELFNQIVSYLNDNLYVRNATPFEINKIISITKLGLKKDNLKMINMGYSMKIMKISKDILELSIVKNSDFYNNYDESNDEVYYLNSFSVDSHINLIKNLDLSSLLKISKTIYSQGKINRLDTSLAMKINDMFDTKLFGEIEKLLFGIERNITTRILTKASKNLIITQEKLSKFNFLEENYQTFLSEYIHNFSSEKVIVQQIIDKMEIFEISDIDEKINKLKNLNKEDIFQNQKTIYSKILFETNAYQTYYSDLDKKINEIYILMLLYFTSKNRDNLGVQINAPIMTNFLSIYMCYLTLMSTIKIEEIENRKIKLYV